MSKNVCFIHSTNVAECGTVILDYLLEYLNSRGVIDKFDFLLINNIGIELDENKYTRINKRIVVVNFSDDISLFECCTIKQMITFSILNPTCNILYLHTKGVSHINNASLYPIIKSWTDYMLYSLVDKFDDCVKVLDDYETVGCNFQHLTYLHDGGEPPHYSGNFWWARASYLKKLNLTDFKTKHDAELKIFSKKPNYFNIYNLTNMYGTIHELHEYKYNVDSVFEFYNRDNRISFCMFDGENQDLSSILSNLISCIYKCMKREVNTTQFIICNSVKTTDSFVFDSFINLKNVNDYLKKYKILIIAKQHLHMNISSILYGKHDVNVIEVKDSVFSNFFSNNTIHMSSSYVLNELCGDPVPGVRKFLYIKYSFTIDENNDDKPIELVDVYAEEELVHIDYSSVERTRLQNRMTESSQDTALVDLLSKMMYFPAAGV